MRNVTPIPAADVKVGDVLESWGFEYPVVAVSRYSNGRVGITVSTGDRSTHLEQTSGKRSLWLVVRDCGNDCQTPAGHAEGCPAHCHCYDASDGE
jgi:hypothetical protein